MSFNKEEPAKIRQTRPLPSVDLNRAQTLYNSKSPTQMNNGKHIDRLCSDFFQYNHQLVNNIDSSNSNNLDTLSNNNNNIRPLPNLPKK